jgi:superfamily II DNA or RNA helicase
MNRIFLSLTFEERTIAKRIPGYWWHEEKKQWSFPMSQAGALAVYFPRHAAAIRAAVALCKGLDNGAAKRTTAPRSAGAWSPGPDPHDATARQVPGSGAQDGKPWVPEQLTFQGARPEPAAPAAPAGYAGAFSAVPAKNVEIITASQDVKLPADQFRRAPYDHQLMMTRAVVAHPVLGLGCEMGTGKSQAIINAVQALAARGEAVKVLVICPKTVMLNWGKEIEINSGMSWYVIEDMKDAVGAGGQDFTIVNYDKVARIMDAKGRDWFYQFNMVVLDESQRIKNHDAARTRAVLKIWSEHKCRKYILSGTPVTKNCVDLFSQLSFLDKKIWGIENFYAWRNRYCVMGGYGGYEIIGYRYQEEIEKVVRQRMVQLKKEDCLQLPEKIYERHTWELTPECRRQYDEMRRNLILQLEKEDITAANQLVKILRLAEITSGHFLADQAKNEKLRALMEIADDYYNNGNQIIIWCVYRKSIEILQQAFKNRAVAVVHGGVEGQERQAEIDRFQAGKAKIFIGQVRTGGLGINLTAASMVIYYENEYNFESRKQSEDRAHRIGQKKNVVYIDLVAKKTIEEVIINALREKQDRAEALVQSFKKGEF